MDGVLGLGSAGAGGLTADVIERLKAEDVEAQVDPIERRIEDWDIEVEQFGAIEAKITELLESAKKFDLFSSGENVFEQIFATTTGTSVSFDATDTSNLTPGTIGVTINQLAQKSVFQVDTPIMDKNNVITTDANSSITIQIGTSAPKTFDTTGKTYDELVTEMNRTTGLDVSLEETSTGSYTLVIKSQETGTANGLTITQSGTTLGNIEEKLPAKDMSAVIDGIDYTSASNKVVLQSGLTITALATGDSSVEIQRDTAGIEVAFRELITNYNDLVDLIEKNTLNADSQIQDTATVRSILSTIKDAFFGTTYGTPPSGELTSDKSMLNYGLSVDASGYLLLDSTIFNEAIVEDYDTLKSILVGPAENEGIGTKIKKYADDLDSFNGLLTSYGNSLSTRRDSLEIEKEKAVTFLDDKYNQLASQFAAYTGIISQFENSFNGLKLIIDQSTAGG